MKKKTYVLLAMILCILLAGCQQDAEEAAPPCVHRIATKITKEATCLEAGTQEHTCQQCGLSITQTIPVTEHSYTEEVTKEAMSLYFGQLN